MGGKQLYLSHVSITPQPHPLTPCSGFFSPVNSNQIHSRYELYSWENSALCSSTHVYVFACVLVAVRAGDEIASN